MLNNKLNFERICELIPNWNWNELKFGYDKSIIANNEIISYAMLILSEDIDQFDRVLELAIANDSEVEEILKKLTLDKDIQDLTKINSKWIFAIIYDAYINLNDRVYEVIEDVYSEFEYPEEISNLIGYMSNNDCRPMDMKLNEYIKINKDIWC